MLTPRTLKLLALIAAAYALLVLPGVVWRPYFDSPAGYLVIVPLFSAYIFHSIGVPGLLEHGGSCGWGLCSPTTFGWIFVSAFWLCAAWLVAWAIGRRWR